MKFALIALCLAAVPAIAETDPARELGQIGADLKKVENRSQSINAAMLVVKEMRQEDPRTVTIRTALLDALDANSDLRIKLEARQKELNSGGLDSESPASRPMPAISHGQGPTPTQLKEAARLAEMKSVRRAETRRSLEKNKVSMTVRVSQVLGSGDWLGYPQKYLQNGEYETAREPICIMGGSGKVDGEIWAGFLYECGTYRYETVSGTVKTVRKYATTSEMALDEINP